MVCTHLDLSRGILKTYAAHAGFCKLWATGNVKNLGKYLEYPKIFSYPMKMWQKIVIPHENVAKYFGTHPALIHSAPVHDIKNDQSLMCLEVDCIRSKMKGKKVYLLKRFDC